jgi:2'-hydroxyisoflavone reductase
MRLLILGGTVFLGRHLVEAALARGHEVTLFNRGRHAPELFPEAEKLRGEREGDLAPLAGRRWDAVIDTSGHLPRAVRASARLLADAVGNYVFISTVSAYKDFPRVAGLDESHALHAPADPPAEQVTPKTVGPLKALCEGAVREAAGARSLVIRAGLLVGPYDPTGRFAYWPRRVAQGGEVLAPGQPSGRVQLIDARDLAGWILRMVEEGQTGAYNATGPERPLTMRSLLETCRDESGSDASFTWVDEDFLLQSGITMGLAPWMPRAPGAGQVNCARAVAAGLAFRPLGETVRDTLLWDAGQPPRPSRGVGLEREREAEMLREWRGLREAAAQTA